jgi:hypothetical protein
MYWGTVMQEHPLFRHPHFGTLQVNYLLQKDKHVLVPLLVDHSTLRNKFMVHDALLVIKERFATSCSLLSNPARTTWLSEEMMTSTQRTVIYFGEMPTFISTFRESLYHYLLC